MMNYQIDRRFVLAPDDPGAPDRVRRLRELGFSTDAPDEELDRFAEKLAHVLGTPFAMVNFVLDTHQYFAGLYGGSTAGGRESARKSNVVDRTMDLDAGFCVHVVDVKHALVLDSVREWPRLGTNAVISDLGVQSYIGAPFYDGTGRILGTVCGISNQRSSWGVGGVELIKGMASQMTNLVARREFERASGSQESGQWLNPGT